MSTTITAAVLREIGEPLHLEEIKIDDPLAHEVLVRVERGLCHSDLHYVQGNLSIDLPAVLGHEATGVVEQVGADVSRFRPGDRVVATLTPACAMCRRCLAGRPTQCERVDAVRVRPRSKHRSLDGSVVSSLGGIGAFAEAIVVTESALAAVPRRFRRRSPACSVARSLPGSGQ